MDVQTLGIIAGAVTTLGVAAISTIGAVILAKLNKAAASREEIKGSIAAVHVLANSNLKAANDRLDKALASIENLNRIVAELNNKVTPPEQITPKEA